MDMDKWGDPLTIDEFEVTTGNDGSLLVRFPKGKMSYRITQSTVILLVAWYMEAIEGRAASEEAVFSGAISRMADAFIRRNYAAAVQCGS